VGYEPTVATFERAKTVHALDRAANVIGIGYNVPVQIQIKFLYAVDPIQQIKHAFRYFRR
jgi:hypothetical protein